MDNLNNTILAKCTDCSTIHSNFFWFQHFTYRGFIHCYRPQCSCGKVMFSQVSVILSTGGCVWWGGACMVRGMSGRGACMVGVCMAEGDMHGRGRHAWQGGHVWQGDVHGRGACMWGCAWQGACVAGGHAWQERQPQPRPQTVHILLECFLVLE